MIKWIRNSRLSKLPWREAGPPNHLDDKVDSDQEVADNLFVGVEAQRQSAHPAERQEAIVRPGGASQREHLQVTSFIYLFAVNTRLNFLHSKDPSEFGDPLGPVGFIGSQHPAAL